MNNTMRKIITDRRMRDYGDYRGRDRRGMDYGRDYDEPMYDGRQGVKGTGRYGIGGSRYYGRDRAEYDYNYNDYNDYGHGDDMRLGKHDIIAWKEKIENADGSYGEHFNPTQIRQAVQSLGVQMNRYSEKELCLAANMLYSDYCEVLKPFIPREKEAVIYVNMARAFLDDPDAAVQGGEKLAAYYYAIVDDDE